jgi:hypothetical protein
MPLRMLGYVFEILAHHQQSCGLPLPPVLPFVFHQGPDEWTVSTAFEDLFGLPADLAAGLLPFLPKFRHALLDLTRFDPATEEADTLLRVVLQLMKLARKRQLLRFFEWLAGVVVEHLPDSLLARMLVYALHADSDLDVEEIFASLSSNPELERHGMSVAEKLIAQGRMEGRMEGRAEGLWVGRIQSLQEFLAQPVTPTETLAERSLGELQSLHTDLHRQYEARYKQA